MQQFTRCFPTMIGFILGHLFCISEDVKRWPRVTKPEKYPVNCCMCSYMPLHAVKVFNKWLMGNFLSSC